MGCSVSVHEPIIDNFESKIKYYKEQSLGSFNSEIILCSGCNKCFHVGSNEIKLNCALCNKFFHCNIAGECMGKNCIIKIDGINKRSRYCGDCVEYKNNECFCLNCYNL